ncbi:hypothetical protein MNV49_004197 [Pseudohyphozyma bogoriensis]|nr:hypothetical protein MNV49_004197 [Pseudohyphozyma bogoriensis]
MPSFLALPAGKFFYLPLLFVIWAISVASFGVTGALISQYGSNFPTGDLGSRTRLLMFGGAWNTLLELILLIGTPVAPDHFGTGWNFVVVFISFLIFLVGAASVTETMNKLPTHDFAKWNLFRAQEGLSWTVCWLSFIALFVIAYCHLNAPEPETQKNKEAETA